MLELGQMAMASLVKRGFYVTLQDGNGNGNGGAGGSGAAAGATEME